jgi:hypothetical protein
MTEIKNSVENKTEGFEETANTKRELKKDDENFFRVSGTVMSVGEGSNDLILFVKKYYTHYESGVEGEDEDEDEVQASISLVKLVFFNDVGKDNGCSNKDLKAGDRVLVEGKMIDGRGKLTIKKAIAFLSKTLRRLIKVSIYYKQPI